VVEFPALLGQSHATPEALPRRAVRYCAALIAAACLLLPAPSAAFELFGMRFFGDPAADRPEVLDPRPYVLDFQVTGADEELAERLRAASNLHSQRDSPPSGTSGLLARARGDFARILAALYRHARYGGTIEIRVAGQPPDALEPDAALPDPVPVTVRIEPGPLYHFGRIAIDNPPPFTTAETRRLESPGELGLVAGLPARSTAITAAEVSLIAAWRQLGHPMAEIASRDIVADHRTRLVDVRLVVAPGPPAFFNGVMVTGTERMDPAFVAYMTGIAAGEEYDPDAVEEAVERLRRLQVFRSVRIEEAEALLPGGFLPLTVRVAERPPRVFGVGVSYSSIDGGTLEGYWTHRNLFGRAERLRIEGHVRRIAGTDPDDFDYLAAAQFTRPGVLTPDTDFVTRIEALRENPDAFDRRSVSARAGLTHRFSPQLAGEASVQVERSRIDDAFGERDFLLASLPGELTYDSRDEQLDPKEGLRATLFAEPFHDFEGGTSALRTRGQISSYWALDSAGRFVLAGRLAAGAVAGAALRDIPSDRLFLAGGGGSVRGYEFQGIGVRLPTGELVGGRSLIEASAELRARVTDQIGIVPFVDVGAVNDDIVPDFSEDLRVGVGVGLRYHTVLGPIRLDVAVPLDPQPGDPDFALYVGIGQAF
jgi:translocation and assembly module TamA